jgi:hypothetical protein
MARIIEDKALLTKSALNQPISESFFIFETRTELL